MLWLNSCKTYSTILVSQVMIKKKSFLLGASNPSWALILTDTEGQDEFLALDILGLSFDQN